MKTVGEQFQEWLDTPNLRAWYESEPKIIQDLVKMYPYEFYIMSDSSPYGISGPGTIVELVSYREDGMIGVVVHPQFLTPADKEHIRALCQIHGQDYETMTSIPHKVAVEPKYLIPYELKK